MGSHPCFLMKKRFSYRFLFFFSPLLSGKAMMLLLIAGWFSLRAQQKYTVSGYVKDASSGESLVGANVYVKGLNQGVHTNNYGFYALTLPAGTYVVVFSYLGFDVQQKELVLSSNLPLNIGLQPRAIISREVVITDKREDRNVSATEMGKLELSIDQMKRLPALLGEIDVLKIIQLLPGVQAAGEGNAGFYIRGGGPDQNLILLDEAPVYNTGHLFGFFSIFNADAIKNTTLIKGGIPANYGGRISSVVDVTMKEGNNQALHGEGGIGLIASRFSLQGPLKKNKASFIVSGRRTYIDLLVKPFVPSKSAFNGSGYYFYDFNAKVNFTPSPKDRVYLSGYFGRDVFTFNNAERTFRANIPWGNSTATARWNHIFNKRLFANTTLLYNDYQFSFGAVQNNLDIRLSSGIRDLNAKIDFDYFANFKHNIKFGGGYTYHTFLPSTAAGKSGDTEFKPDNPFQKYAHEMALYLLDDYELSAKVRLNVGLRYSAFQQVGPYTRYTRYANGNKQDSLVYRRLQPVKTYGGLEPRLVIRYSLDSLSAFKASLTRNYQYIHLVSNAASTLPTDLWVPSTDAVKPQVAWQYALGYFRNFRDNAYEASLETYYKDMRNQIEFKPGYTPSLKDPEEEFVFGRGWSYGAELFLNKKKGRFTGWIGYTLAWTWRQFPALNQGKKYPAKYDRRHDLSLVGSYVLNDQWTFSGVFIYASGNAYTLPQNFYFVEGTLSYEYGPLNSNRMKAYHRLDLSAIYTPWKNRSRKLQTSWVFSVYNVYSHLNPYFIYINQKGSLYDGTLELKAKQVSLFPILPAVTWNFKF